MALLSNSPPSDGAGVGWWGGDAGCLGGSRGWLQPGIAAGCRAGERFARGGDTDSCCERSQPRRGNPCDFICWGRWGGYIQLPPPWQHRSGEGARESAGISSVTLLLACPQPKQKGFGGGLGRCIHRAAACLVPGLSVTCGGRGARARAEPLSVCCSSLRRAGAKCHLWHAAVVPKPGLLLSGYGLGLL